MVDAGASDAFWPQNYKWAVRTADMLAAYNVAWFEEPLTPDSLEDFRALRAVSKVPIAGGEVLTRRQSFQPWLEGRAFDIVQPDVTKCGGLSEQRRIAWTAREHGVKFIPHGWNTAVGLASDLQVASAFPETDLVEYLTGSAFIDDLVSEPWKLDGDGMLEIRSKPGLGIEINLDALSDFARIPRTQLNDLS
jgi:L-alanine-DL-glutamate epimerase-like enolase superfamily enzyme